MADDVPVSFYPSCGLYLKMEARINIEVRLPEIRNPGVSVSNWEIMEKLKIQSAPEEYVSLRVILSSREVIRFEGELDSVRALKKVVLMINGRTIKLKGFSDPLKIRAFIAEDDSPTKQEWEDYFISKGIETFDDGKPGERPDTIHVKGLPVKWFTSKSSEGKPCPRVITQAFQKFGKVRQVGFYDPSGDVSSKDFSSFGPSGSGSEVLNFESYIQYDKYPSFCSAMSGLCGMKLMRLQAGGQAETRLKVTYDKTGFLSDRAIRKRLHLEEKRRKEIELEEKEREKKQKEEETKRQEEILAREREEEEMKAKKQEEKRLKKLEQEKVAMELKRIAIQRRTEAQRLMRVLLAGAAEERYQEEKKERVGKKRKQRKLEKYRQESDEYISELKSRVDKLEGRKQAIEKELYRRNEKR